MVVLRPLHGSAQHFAGHISNQKDECVVTHVLLTVEVLAAGVSGAATKGLAARSGVVYVCMSTGVVSVPSPALVLSAEGLSVQQPEGCMGLLLQVSSFGSD